MMSLLVAVIGIFCCCSTIGHCQVTSYVLKVTQNPVEEGGLFDTTLACQTKLGFDTSNALFYRNGGDVNNDQCLNSTVYLDESAVGRIKLKIMSECDGYYSCGVQQSSDDYVLSRPRAIYTKPTEIGTGKEMISAEEGETVQIPCKVSQSPIGTYKTVWYNHGSPPVKIRTLTSSDNDLVLNNVTDGYHEGSYYCAVHTDQPLQGTIVSSYLNGLVQLSIRKKFVEPAFLRNLTFTIVNGRALFEVISMENEDYPINYRWEVNDTVIENSETSLMVIEDISNGLTQVRVTIWNTKYTGTIHSKMQAIFVDRSMLPQSQCETQQDTSVIDCLSNPAMIGILVAAAAVIEILFICLCLALCHVMKTRRSSKPSTSDEANNNRSSEAVDMDSHSHAHDNNPLNKIFLSLGRLATDTVDNGYPMEYVIMKCLCNLVRDIRTSNKISINYKTKQDLTKILNEIIEFQNYIDNQSDLISNEVRETQLRSETPSPTDEIRFDGNTLELDSEDHHIITSPNRSEETRSLINDLVTEARETLAELTE